MALTVTPGSEDADSYATVAAADAYHSDLGAAAWTGTDAVKEAALRRATAWIDGRYRARFPGVRTYARAQALEWPRVGADDAEGTPIPSDEIPDEVVAATCEAALRELVSAGSLSPDVTSSDAVKRAKAGPVEVEFASPAVTAAMARPTLTVVEDLLGRLFRIGGGVVTYFGRA